MPERSECEALLALMLLHDSRREARTDADDQFVLLRHQDRSRWNQAQMQEGLALIEKALRDGAGRSRYGLEASIAAVHASAKRYEDTDWRQIAALYSLLAHIAPSPVVDLNRAVAVSMVEGPEMGLRLLARLEDAGDLSQYHLLPAAQAYMFRALERWEDASRAYRRAIELARHETERRLLDKLLADVETQRGFSTASSAV
jgi:RNA polymerase sigma-70 factor (ECF subfamily)